MLSFSPTIISPKFYFLCCSVNSCWNLFELHWLIQNIAMHWFWCPFRFLILLILLHSKFYNWVFVRVAAASVIGCLLLWFTVCSVWLLLACCCYFLLLLCWCFQVRFSLQLLLCGVMLLVCSISVIGCSWFQVQSVLFGVHK